jgi:peptidoglycan hydrolase-like protein with peptidoglycan-binding domain
MIDRARAFVRGVPLGLAAGALAAAVSIGGCGHTHAQPKPPQAIPATKAPVKRGAETGIPVASTPQGFLKDDGEKKLQRRLRAKGFLTAEQESGKLDDATREALRRYQKSEGLPATGLPSYETARHLGLNLDSIYMTTRRPRDPPPRSD